jgi:Aspartyl protease/PDZ domain
MKSSVQSPVHLMAAILLLLCVYSVGSAQELGRFTSAPGVHFTSGKSARRIPFMIAANHIFIQVRVNNSAPSWFVLDSGAGDSVVDRRKAMALKLKLTGEDEGSGIGEKTVEAGLVKGLSLRLPGVELLGQTLYAAPLDSLEPAAGRPVGGLLGYDFFNRFVVEIDYAALVINLYDPVSYRYSSTGESIPITLERNHAFARASIVSSKGSIIEGKFLIDTGGARVCDLTAPFVEMHKLLGGDERTIPGFVAGIGGQINLRIGRLKSLQLGHYVVKAPVVGFSQATKGASASSEMDGIIGGDLLSRFKVILDYSRKRIILEPNSHFARSDEYDMSGMRLISGDSKFKTFKVQRIIENSPAIDAGLREGDVIFKIDGSPAAKLTLERMRQMFKQPGRSYVLSVKRGDEVIQTKIKLRRLI